MLPGELRREQAASGRGDGGSEQKIDGFRAGEEVALGVSGGDGDGAACGDLSREGFADAAFGAEDVGEA